MNTPASSAPDTKIDSTALRKAIPEPVSEDTITFKRSHLYAVLLPLAFVLGLSVGYLFWGRAAPESAPAVANSQTSAAADSQTPVAAADSQAADATQQALYRRYDVPVDDDPVIGPADAAITIIEFSDFECPFCQQWHSEVYGALRSQYPDQVRIVFRDFPLESIHPNATPAAEAANCANEQGKFWEYHDRLFGAQYGLGAEALLKYASEVGLDEMQFTACVNDRKYQDEVQADLEYAVNLGVRSTPTFFINGLPIVGAQPLEVFQNVIQKELAGEIPK